jgi:hypothetical protein
LNNIKQLVTALQNHHDTKKGLPLASTAPFRQGAVGAAPNDNKIKYGAVGKGAPQDTPPFTNWSPGQNGDGYSWIVLLLPFMEENTVWDKLNDAKRGFGRLQDAAFATGVNAATQSPGVAPDATKNPHLASTKINTLVCPSYPGDEDVSFILASPMKVGTGNYMAISSTHYQSGGDLESGLPAQKDQPENKGCTSGAYCGNGGMPFPGIVSGRVQKTGLGFQSLSDGTSKVPLVTESREDVYTSWYSGLASYVVAAWPNSGGAGRPVGVSAAGPQATTAPFYWGCVATACDVALNKGDTKGDKAKFYQSSSGSPNPHIAGGDRNWGPSSRHPSIVLHGFADAHSEAVNEQVDKSTYLQMITRSGREVPTNQQ